MVWEAWSTPRLKIQEIRKGALYPAFVEVSTNIGDLTLHADFLEQDRIGVRIGDFIVQLEVDNVALDTPEANS